MNNETEHLHARPYRAVAVAKSTASLDATGLRKVARLGGLDLPEDRAAALLPLYSALMSSCDRLEKVDPDWAGKPAPERERKR